MISNISQIKRKAKLEKAFSYFSIFLAYVIPICLLIIVGLFSLTAVYQSF